MCAGVERYASGILSDNDRMEHANFPTAFRLSGLHFLGTLPAHRPAHEIAKTAMGRPLLADADVSDLGRRKCPGMDVWDIRAFEGSTPT